MMSPSTAGPEPFFNFTTSGPGCDLVFKCPFRKHLLEYVLSVIKDEQRSMKSEVDILMGMHLVKKACVSVHPHVLIDVFIKAGFKLTLNQSLMQPPDDDRNLIEDFTRCVY
ncbi:unnamed protein product [Echinostoma caproni]|uniref:BTB/POZ domain-containing protein n=1 Tax=Echinostoma caproni TaxID=27848 RepID=A0A183ATM7_9TREM|nr:unnamed protein product [Echinostoma caproni]